MLLAEKHTPAQGKENNQDKGAGRTNNRPTGSQVNENGAKRREIHLPQDQGYQGRRNESAEKDF